MRFEFESCGRAHRSHHSLSIQSILPSILKAIITRETMFSFLPGGGGGRVVVLSGGVVGGIV